MRKESRFSRSFSCLFGAGTVQCSTHRVILFVCEVYEGKEGAPGRRSAAQCKHGSSLSPGDPIIQAADLTRE